MALTSVKLDKLADQESGEILNKGRHVIRDLKRQNFKLKQEVKLLANNNKAMEKLIEILEEQIKKITDNMAKRYAYSFEGGGWNVKGSLDKKKMRIEGYKRMGINTINSQLEELLRLVVKHRKRLK